MKRTGLAFLLFVIVFSGCRKGEDDPFISLRSRTNRLCGKWRLIESTQMVCFGENTSAFDSYQIQLNGGQCVVTYRGFEVDKFSYIQYLSFDKNGNYRIETESSGDNSVEEGKWSWCGKDKNREFKSKECLYLTCEKYNFNQGEEVNEYSGISNSPANMLMLKKLSKDTITYYTEIMIHTEGFSSKRIETTAKRERIE